MPSSSTTVEPSVSPSSSRSTGEHFDRQVVSGTGAVQGALVRRLVGAGLHVGRPDPCTVDAEPRVLECVDVLGTCRRPRSSAPRTRRPYRLHRPGRSLPSGRGPVPLGESANQRQTSHSSPSGSVIVAADWWRTPTGAHPWFVRRGERGDRAADDLRIRRGVLGTGVRFIARRASRESGEREQPGRRDEPPRVHAEERRPPTGITRSR